MKYRYALDQTNTKNQAIKFLTDKAKEHNIIAYGWYKGNGKQYTDLLEINGILINEKIKVTEQFRDYHDKNKISNLH